MSFDYRFIFTHLWKFLSPIQRLKFSHVCRGARRIVLSKENEYIHMIECLDLTLGCWRGTGYFKDNPWTYRRMSYGMDSDDDDDDNGDVGDTSKSVLEDQVMMTSDEAVHWLLLRVAIDCELKHMNRSVESVVSIDGKAWIQMKDSKLDKMNYRLKHFGRGFLENDHIGHRQMLVFKAPASEFRRTGPSSDPMDSVERTPLHDEDEALDCLQPEVCMKQFGFPFYELNWFESRLECFAKSLYATLSTEFEFYDLHESHVGIPFLIRVLLQEKDLIIDRLCDVEDQSLTPGHFLKTIHETGGVREEAITVFGYNVIDILLRNTNVYKLPYNTFWDLTVFPQIGIDPDFQWGDNLMSWLCPSEFAMCDMERSRMAERSTYAVTDFIEPFHQYEESERKTRYGVVTAKPFGHYKKIRMGPYGGIIYS
eukprot:Protomagalhaensia_sp_Gyna_25__1499@NODE_1769_length_1549_cov_626_610596_g1450_i0_p1_GENE_NODE_1769_length_1549_cov_626_610596_g1450_i0NODE_1769_length_1549_cov_626_610596_g1450_i0_p1_ORF_typecomplete_len424_score57_47Fboxlike/PF12937_7/0_26Fbox/PF00646_33/0_24_NODE_1769_length_1549_cov_626_610596_g1450_i01741445